MGLPVPVLVPVPVLRCPVPAFGYLHIIPYIHYVHTLHSTEEKLSPSKVQNAELIRLAKVLELYTDSVFSVGIRSVFLGIYHTDTEGKLGRYISV